MNDQKLLPEPDDDIIDILAGTPVDELRSEVEPPPLDEEDFDPPSEPEEPDQEPEEPDQQDEQIEDHTESQEDVRQSELSEKSQEIKQRFVKMMKPSRIVGFGDMILSRCGSFLMKKTAKRDWQLDKDEKEFLADALDVMVEEEGIQFWPAKVWFVLAIIFFFGMKTLHNYDRYYSKKGKFLNSHREDHEKYMTDHQDRMRDLAKLETEAQYKEQLLKVKRRIEMADLQLDGQHIPPSNNTNGVATNGASALANGQGVNDEDFFYKTEDFDPQNDQQEVTQADGGFRYRHPVTKQFMNEEDYMALMAGNDPEIIEAEEV